MTPMPNAPSPNAIFGEALAPPTAPLSTVEEQLAQARGLNAQVPVQQQTAQELALKNQLTQRSIKNLQLMHDNLPGLLQASGGKWDDSIRNGLIAKGMDADEVEKVVGEHYMHDESMARTTALNANAKKVNQEVLDHNNTIAARMGTGMLGAVKPDGTLDLLKVQAQLLNAKAQNPDFDIAPLMEQASKDPEGFMAKMEAARQARPDVAKDEELARQEHFQTTLKETEAQKAQFEQKMREYVGAQLGIPGLPGAPIAQGVRLNTGVNGHEIPFIADAVSREIDRTKRPADWQEAYGAAINQLMANPDDRGKMFAELHKVAERGAATRQAVETQKAEEPGKIHLAGAEEEARQNVALRYLNAQGGTSQLARDIADYKVPLATALSNRIPLPARDAILAEVNRLNPDFNASNFAIKQRTENDAITGKIGTQRSALNTMMGHLSILNQAADALNNSDFPALNRIANFLGVQVGGTAKTTYETIVHRLGPEVTKAYIAGGGSVGERGTNESDFSPSLAPGQLKANVGISAQLAGSLIDALENRYKGGTFGRGNLQTLLSPEAQAARQQLAGQSPVGRTAPPMPRVLTAADVGKTYTKGGKVWRITRVNPTDGTKFLADEVR